MAEIVTMPKLSDTMTEGVVAAWHKKVGDAVKSGEILAEIETDKATMEFESYYDGVLLHQGVAAGKAAPVDSLLAIIGKKGEDISAILKEAKAGATAGKDVEVEKGVKEEEKSAKQEKAPPESVEPSSQKPEQKSEARTATSAPAPAPAFAPMRTATAEAAPANGRVKASPLAKRLAEERGIDIARVRGTGDDGRITKHDIESYLAGGMAPAAAQVESFTEVPVSQMRKTIAKRLAESKFSAPHFYLTIAVDMGNAMAAREAINKAVAPDKISFNDLVVKACAMALRQHPKVNSSWLGDKIRYNEHVHIGVAVAVEEGLLVPVVRFADTKPLRTIGAEVREFAKRAKDKKLQPQDWEGNTFTISNLGMFGIDEFTAIINPPDACILAVGAIMDTAVVKGGAVVPGHIMKVTLSCDHRVVDGVTGAMFLNSVRDSLENPVLMLGAASI
ncbi:MAG: pyruvate dehydrogenase complex dihydrolipoamide acetyltransferase [Flavobacteriales bacterium]|jgi:pyruvate dehydrogenase E2 component (dihydrolipoamide acetyltransferase)|nr:pyruvate dehydrogenase complex dihydrolipoamide acetyltransferase [Flavobacteriales bacterium]